jgi:hypothetical protein
VPLAVLCCLREFYAGQGLAQSDDPFAKAPPSPLHSAAVVPPAMLVAVCPDGLRHQAIGIREALVLLVLLTR